MADDKHFIEKIMDVLHSDDTLKSLFGRDRFVGVAYFMPVGNVYPQICIWLDEGESETVFPAGHYKFTVTIWVKKEMNQRYDFMRKAIKALNSVVNRKASSLSEIDVAEDLGLRVARCVKQGGNINFNDEVGMYFSEIIYDMVIGEDESFAPENAGNREWV